MQSYENASPKNPFQAALRKLLPSGTGIFAHRDLWTTLALLDLRNRYRGSVLGPLWLTLATGVLIGGIGLLYGGLFRQPIESYLPFVAISLVIWTLITTTISESATLFIGEGQILRQLPVPASIFVARLIYRNILVFLHNLVILVVVWIVFPPDFSFAMLFSLIGFLALIANLWWVSVMVSIVAARFRDIPPIVFSVLQILFFITPIIWSLETLPDRMGFIALNPIYHWIEAIRAPFIGSTDGLTSLVVSLVSAVVGTILSLRVLAWARTRLVYWL